MGPEEVSAFSGLPGSFVIVKAQDRRIIEKGGKSGYDARTREFTDMVKAGIIDPAKVSRVALQNAASVAGLMLTTEVLVTDLKDEEEEVAGAVR